jgi:hypothetical protein
MEICPTSEETKNFHLTAWLTFSLSARPDERNLIASNGAAERGDPRDRLSKEVEAEIRDEKLTR